MSHPPIHPLKFVPLQGDHARLFEFITRHFLACCSKDAVGESTRVEIDICGERFTASGQVVKERNFLEVYTYDKWFDHTIPDYTNGEMFRPTQLLMRESQTGPPSLLTEAELIMLMNHNGIGTDATIAQHIATILEREYARKLGDGRFEPSPIGIALVMGCQMMGLELHKPRLRAKMEERMRLVSSGVLPKISMLNEDVANMRNLFTEFQSKGNMMEQALRQHFRPAELGALVNQAFSRCGSCGGMLSLHRRDQRSLVLQCSACAIPLEIPSADQVVPHEHTCPYCRYQVVRLRSTERQSEYTVCPYCFTNVPADQNRAQPAADAVAAADDIENVPNGQPAGGGGGAAAAEMLTMRCFECTHRTCPLAKGVAGGQLPVVRCPKCRDGQLMLRRANGRYYLRCRTDAGVCKFTCAVPGAETVAVVDEVCGNCHHARFRRLSVRIHRQRAPPGVEPEFVGCIGGCDANMNQLLEMDGGEALLPVLFERGRGAAAAGAAAGRGRAAPIAGPAGAMHAQQFAAPAPAQAAMQQWQAQMQQNQQPQQPWQPQQPPQRQVPPPPQLPPPPQQQQQYQFGLLRDADNGGGMWNGAAGSAAAGWGPPQAGPYAPARANGFGGGGGGGAPTPACPSCNRPATRLRSSKGDNAGRFFFKCEACASFVSWEDEAGGAGAGAGVGVGAGRNCYRCGQPGHFSSNCPNSGAGGMAGGGGGGAGAAAGAVCYNCNMPGHFANACPGAGAGQPAGGKGGGRGTAMRGDRGSSSAAAGANGGRKRSAAAAGGGGGGGGGQSRGAKQRNALR